MSTLISTSDALANQPRGGRIGVAFSWGLAVQQVTQALAIFLGLPLDPRLLQFGVVGALGMLVGAGLFFALGEGLRRGRGWAWWLQLIFCGLVGLGGLASLPIVLPRIAGGDIGALYTLLLMLVVAPVEVWLLLQPGSRRWYGHISSAAAMQRHSGPWLAGTVAFAVVCGVLQALVTAT